MEELIKTYNETGNCEVDVDKVVNTWNDKFSISQWNKEYRLIEQIKLLEEPAYKVGISEEQALEIIFKLKLLPIQNGFFSSGKTWRSKSNIISEKERIKKIITQSNDSNQIKILSDINSEFDRALLKEIPENKAIQDAQLYMNQDLN
jgi:hypothetical protein